MKRREKAVTMTMKTLRMRYLGYTNGRNEDNLLKIAYNVNPIINPITKRPCFMWKTRHHQIFRTRCSHMQKVGTVEEYTKSRGEKIAGTGTVGCYSR